MSDKAKAGLEMQLEEARKEIAYYKRLSKESGDKRLKEAEELSGLIAKLKEAEKALQKARDELEKRVEERTDELSKANLILKQEISERKRVEEALRESEQRFRSLAETISDWVWEVDQNGFYTYSNPKVRDLIGYEPVEVVGRKPFDFMLQDERERVSKLFMDIVESHKPFSQLENVNLHKDGRRIVLETSGVPIFDERGDYSGYRGIDRDITERKRAEETLRESEDKYRQLFELESDAIFLIDNESGQILELNTAASVLYGYSRQEILGKKNSDLSAEPEETRKVTQTTPPTVDTVVSIPIRFHRKKDGTVFPVEITGRFFTWLGRSVHIAAIRDITDHKRTEEELIEREKFNFALFEYNPIQTVVVDLEGKITGFNLAKKKSGDRLPNIGDVMYKDYAGSHEINMYAELMKCIRSREKKEFPEQKYRGKILSTTISPFPKGAVIISQDITERKRIEEERLIFSKLESTGILAGGIAHDFNNLLTIILGNLELARVLTPSGKKIASYLEAAEKATLMARGLTQELITFAEGGASLRKLTSLSGLIRESVVFSLRGSPVGCDFSIPDDLWWVEVDEGQMGQVIRNMVLNAREVMPEGGVVSVRAENVVLSSQMGLSLPEGKYVRVNIADQGSGISEEVLPKIFDPYFSTKQRGNRKGMGLGLTICHSVVQRHGGAITVESEVGVGTTFHIYLPASGKEVGEEKAAIKEVLPEKGRVLVMDDEEMVRDAVGEELRFLGYKVVFAGDGQGAIELYTRAQELGEPFDVVILDLTVPGRMGGNEAIKQLLEIDPNIKAIVSSGYSNDPILLKFEQYGFKGALTKPYGIEKLSQTLSKIIGSVP